MNKKHLAMSTKLAALPGAAIALHDHRRGGSLPIRYRNHHHGMNAWREHHLRPPP